MASPVAISSVLTGMANQLAVMLNTGGEEGRKAWEILHGKLADVTTSIADTRITIEALLNKLKETGSLVLGYPDAQVLLRQMMEHVEEKVSAQSAADASQAIPLLKNLILLVAGQLDMTPLCDSVYVDMIDGNAAFKQQKVDYMVSSSVELSHPSTPYTVVSIIGPQSSGKSFLLNHLFGTKFPVMDPRRGRYQATRGILISRCIEPSMLVLDTEGLDGMLGGEDASFEKQVTLFALTVSDVMLVNISIHNIGREKGSGTSLMRTICQEGTKLPPGLTNIVVVLRYYDGEMPFDILKHDVIYTFQEIWRTVNRESKIFTDYIQIDVVWLPDKNSEDFLKQILPAKLYCQQTVEVCMGQVERAREAIEEQKRSENKVKELIVKLEQLTEERLRREGEIQREQDKYNQEKEALGRRQQVLENELQIQKEHTRKIEEERLERAREAVEKQEISAKKMEELTAKIDQMMEERLCREGEIQQEEENNKRAKEEMEHRQQTLENKLEIQQDHARKLEEAQAHASMSINLPIHFWLKWLLCPDYESLQACIEDPPITASHGPIDRLICRLQLLEVSRHALPVELSVYQIKCLREHFQEFRNNFAAGSLMSQCWVKEVRELCYDTEDYLEEVTMESACCRLGNLGRMACIFVHCFLQRPHLSQFIDRANRLEQMFPECLDEENEAASSVDQGQEADPYLHIEQNAHVESLPSELVNQLAFDNGEQTPLKVVAISGCAGSEKTALASTVYLKYERRFQCRAFVRASRNPDFRSLLSSILSQIKAPTAHGFPNVQGLIDSINKHLQCKRYLIVIDGVRETSVWDIISCAFPIGNCGSRIIITTQSEHVASTCCGCEFESSTFKMDDLSSCRDTASEEKNEVINLAYNNLPLELKTCLLYLSMYPEGCTMTKGDLVKQWIAEGFIPASKCKCREEISEVTQNKTEEIAGGYFDELIARGMIQPVERNHKGQVLSCTVHHMVLDFIKYKSKVDNFIVVAHNLESTVGHPDIVRRLSIQFGCEKGAVIPGSFMLSQVRSLAFYGFLKSVSSIGIYGLLRVLIISVWADEDKIFDLTRIGELYHMRYLKIECNITVRLPSKIRQMKHLGTLELHAEVVAIPSDIGHLEKLKHILCPSKANILDLGGLINLLDLQITWSTLENLKENMNCLRSILEKLGNLRCLFLVPASGLYNVNALQDESGVSRMSISCDSLCMVSPALAHLQRLELSRHCCIFSRLPKWLGELAELRILKIAIEELLKEDTDILKAIPSPTVVSLHVKKMSVERVVFGKGGFLVLTYFKFTCTVPWLKFEADAMPNLEKLKLCFNATTVVELGETTPIIIEHLSSGLKEITAVICCARGLDASSVLKAISNDPSNPDVQLMGSIYYGDECRGIHCRYQATRGILISRCIEPSMLVLDTEGLDGMLGGEDASFEKQVTLFALTVSDVMLVNISIHNIGREKGSGTSLMRTICQEGTKLPPGLTNIVVVLRYYDGEMPFDILKHDVIYTFQEIWRTVNRESKIFTDYIQIDVVWLPDKNSEDFLKQVTALRMLLTNFTGSAKVPASSFSPDSKMLWDQIKQNKKIDLPPHMILPAKLYCQQTVEVCMGQVERAREAIEEQKRSENKVKELIVKLEQLTEERLRREGEIQREQDKYNQEKEAFGRRQQVLENELQIQKEHTRKIEEERLERAREAVEKQEISAKKMEELTAKIDQMMEERLCRRGRYNRKRKINKRAKEEMEHRQQTLENKLEIQQDHARKLEEAQAHASMSINLPIHFWLKWLLCPDYESLQACIEDPPITASHGPIDRLICRLQLLEVSRHALPVELSVYQIKGLREHFQEFRNNFAAGSLMSQCWVKEVRELCYDTEDYLEEVTMESACCRLGNLGRMACIFVHCFLQRPHLSQFIDRANRLEQMFPECLDEENEAASSVDQGQEADPYLHIEQNAHVESLPSELVNQLAFDNGEQTPLKVVAISGCAGSEKTALASTVYLKYKRRFQCRAFVRASRNPDFRSLLTSILSQIKAPTAHGFPNVQGLIDSINKHLQCKRYLIVIDGVRETSVWDIISCAFPIGNCGSRIIITTQSEHVASTCCGCEFESSTFKMDDLSSCTDTASEEKNEVINLAYNNLPLELKTCLLYLSMYPEGCTMTKGDLVKQWIAEGFIPASKSKCREEISEVTQNKTEEIAGGYFDELIARGMIQPVERNHKGQVLSCTVHHMVLDFIKYKSKVDNFIVVAHNLESTVGHPDIVRRLSIQFGCEKGAVIPGSFMLSQVRSLAFYGFLKSVSSIGIYGLLRVLIISVWADEDKIFDLTRIGELYHMRYLKMECNITVRLPSKIRQMKHLGTLELHAEVVAIPSDIGHLEKLKHILCPSKANILDLGGLINLLDLQITWSTLENLKENMNCLRSILEKLGNLRCLFLVPASGLYNVNALQDESGVSRMSISCDSLCMVSPAPAHLQRLELSRHCCIFSRLPKWLGELAELRILKIAIEELLKEDTDILKAIPSLTVVSLHVKKMSAERVVFGKGGFLVLTYFKFTCTVPWLKFEADAMPNLEKLKLCFNATTVVELGETTPIIIEHLSSGLKEITAVICCARGLDASSVLKAISNDPSNPDVQLMGSIYYGDECRGIHCRILMPPESSDLLFPVMERPYNELEKKLHDPNVSPMSFPLKFLKTITSDFSTESVLGQGGFGVVYKGVLTCGKIIAVKKFYEVSILEKEEAFQNEVCSNMGKKHPNVVQCLGCCAESSTQPMELPSGSGKYILAETRERLLCFEYICNKSLETHITDQHSGLEWKTRYTIIKGICNGLHFLHEECHMVHLDLKPQNILMNSTMVPKIADFGLSRIFGEEESRIITKNHNVGTRGYMAPEYFQKGVVSYSADIFSLGVIIIEIITGGRDYPMDYPYFQQDSPQRTDPSFRQFTENVLGSWRKKFESTQKHNTVEKYTQQVKKCVAIALNCVDPHMKKRPTVKYIIELLNEAGQIGDSHFEMRETPDVAVEIIQVKEEIDAKLDRGEITGSDEKAYPDEEHVNVVGKQLEENPK